MRDDFFNSLYIDDAAFEQKNASPERRLWNAVLILIVRDAQQIRDAIANKTQPGTSAIYASYSMGQNVNHAREQLIRVMRSDWLEEICAMANFPHAVFKESIYRILGVITCH